MNKLLTALITAFVVAGFIGTTANAVSTATLPETAMVPGDALYDTKRSLEESIESLAPNKSAKAKAKIEQLNSRAAEMKKLAAQNRTELLNQTAKEYAQEMKSLQNFGNNISNLAQQRKINELVARATQLHTEVLSNVYKKVPEQAQSAIKRAMNQSVTGHRKAVASLEKTGGVPSGIGNVSEHIPSGLQGKMGGPTNIPTAGQGTGGDQNGTGGQAPGTPTGY